MSRGRWRWVKERVYGVVVFLNWGLIFRVLFFLLVLLGNNVKEVKWLVIVFVIVIEMEGFWDFFCGFCFFCWVDEIDLRCMMSFEVINVVVFGEG